MRKRVGGGGGTVEEEGKDTEENCERAGDRVGENGSEGSE